MQETTVIIHRTDNSSPDMKKGYDVVKTMFLKNRYSVRQEVSYELLHSDHEI